MSDGTISAVDTKATIAQNAAIIRFTIMLPLALIEVHFARIGRVLVPCRFTPPRSNTIRG